MGVSPLAKRRTPHRGKYSSRGGAKIVRVILHHWAGTSGGEETLSNPNRQASAHYLAFSDGSISSQVDEDYRAWTSGSAAADNPSITIEIQNSGGRKHGNDNHRDSWPISAKAQASVEALIADIARRHGWKTINVTMVRGHREFQATACPGGFVWHRRSSIAANALSIFRGITKPAPKPSPSKPSDNIAVDGLWGPATTRRVQQVLKTPVDGKVSRQPNAFRKANPGLVGGWQWVARPGSSPMVVALQRRLGVSADGRIGPQTISALQRRLGTPVDGKVSRPSTMVRALQRNLNSGKLW